MKIIKEKLKKFEDEENIDLSENEKNVKNRFRKIQIVALISFLSIIILLIFNRSGNMSIDSIVESASGNPIKSIISLLSLFAVKSLTIIVPIGSLYLASGIIFEPLKAVLINYLGLSITLTIPFILGRWSGTEEMDYLRKKYPKLKQLIEMQKKNEFLASFLIRLIGWFPCDIISFYFGAC